MRLRIFGLLVSAVLTACSDLPKLETQEPPVAFHNTRLQYALLTGQEDVLVKEYGMTLPPSWAEQAAAGLAIPFTAASEAAFLPVATGIKAWAPEAPHSLLPSK